MLCHIAIKKGAGYNLLTVKEFLALPVNERVELILDDKVQFLNEDGNAIPPGEALKLLREVSASA